MHRSILLYGPQGSGKTLIAQHLAAHLKLTQVIDEFDPLDRYPAGGSVLIADQATWRFTGRQIHISEAFRLLHVADLQALISRGRTVPGIKCLTQHEYIERTGRRLYSHS